MAAESPASNAEETLAKPEVQLEVESNEDIRFEHEFTRIRCDSGFVESATSAIASGIPTRLSGLSAGSNRCSGLTRVQLRKLLLQFGYCMSAQLVDMLLTELGLDSTPKSTSGHGLDLEACQLVLQACRERWRTPPDISVYIFVNPASGGNMAARWLEIPASLQFHGLRASGPDLLTDASLYVLSLRDASLGEQPGFLKLLEQASHSTAKSDVASKPMNAVRPHVIVAGGDGTVTWVLSELEQRGVDCSALAVGVCPYGTGNDFSRVLGWGSSPLAAPHKDIDSLHDLMGQWLSAELVPLDIWALRVATKSGGSFAVVQTAADGSRSLGLTQADAERLHVQTTAEGSVLSRHFVNYFSMGVASQIGISFDKNRGTSRAANYLVYAKEGAKKALSSAESVEVDAIVSQLTEREVKIFDTHSEASKEEMLNDRVLSLIFLNIPSMAGGSDVWGRSTSFAVNSARRFQDLKQDFGDGCVELLTYSSALGFVREKLGPAFHGNGHRLYSGRGPFQLNFKNEDDDEYVRALKKTDGWLCMQTDGEYFAVGAPASVEVSWAHGITALRARRSEKAELEQIFRDGARLLHFIEFATRNGDCAAAAWAHSSAVHLCSGVELSTCCDCVVGGSFDAICRPAVLAYQTDPEGLRGLREWRDAGRAPDLSRSKSDALRAFHDVGGSEVDEEHGMYAVAISLVRGIRLAGEIHDRILHAAVLRQTKEESDSQISPEQISSQATLCLQQWLGPTVDVPELQVNFVRRFEISRAGNFLSMPVEVPFVFEDAAPDVFYRLRALAGVSQSTYYKSLGQDEDHLRTFSSNSKSGEWFFFSHNGLFMIKTISISEVHKLLETLPTYEEHLRTYPNSLLTRYLGLHRIVLCREAECGTARRATSACWFVVMSSVFHTSLGIHEKYDLKGSTAGRKADGQDADIGRLPQKDLDWLERFKSQGALRLSPSTQKSLIQQHDLDTSFLESFGIMDYSVLVGVHHCQKARDGEHGFGSSRSLMSNKGAHTAALAASMFKGRLSTLRAASKQRVSEERVPLAMQESTGETDHTNSSVDDQRVQDQAPDNLCDESTPAETKPDCEDVETKPDCEDVDSASEGRSLAYRPKLGEAITSADSTELYFIGIIDTLSTFDTLRAAQDIYNRGTATLTFTESGHSAVNPTKYRERQKDFFCRVCGVEPASQGQQTLRLSMLRTSTSHVTASAAAAAKTASRLGGVAKQGGTAAVDGVKSLGRSVQSLFSPPVRRPR